MNDEQLADILAKNKKMECACEYGPLDDSGNQHLPACVRDDLQWDVQRLVQEVRVLRATNRVLEAERDLARIEKGRL